MNSMRMRNRFRLSRPAVHSLTVLVLFAAFAAIAPVSATAAVTKAEVKDVSGELICYCGCASKVVATCGCATADKIEGDIAAQLESGQTKEEIVAAYMAQHGEKGLATPVADGFNLTAWLMPITAIMLGGIVIRKTVVRWRAQKRGRENAENDAPSDIPDEKVAKHQNRILNDLEEMD